MADQALEQGSPDRLIKAILARAEEGIRERFDHALDARKHAAESVAASRAWVEAYVTYVHYVEGVAGAVRAAPGHAAEAAAPAGHAH